jgi:acetyl-CoA acetyltransferase/uncharacterized OB-fold protein
VTDPGTSREAAVRPLPALTADTALFWQGGAEGELRLKACPPCGTLHHPSATVCPGCLTELGEWQAVAGTGVVVGATVNAQMWLPGMRPPYAIVVVALDDAPGVRLTSNLVGAPPEQAAVGARVRVRFAQQEDIWFPLFELDPERPEPDLESALLDAPQVRVRPPASTARFEERVVLSGVGMSQVGRRLMRTPLSLTVDACRAAVEDAGLTMDDIDGLSTYPGPSPMGMSEGGVAALERVLGVHPTWFNSGFELPGQAGSIVAAMLAVSSGLARHVLCFRTVWEATHSELMRTGGLPPPAGGRVSGEMAYRLPFGAASASNWIAMMASQYLAKYGATRETLGEIAVNARANAVRNPAAIYRDPLTMDDYLSARTITTPFGLYDCDVPCDGAIAVIVSAAETAPDLHQLPVRVAAVGTAIGERISWDQGTFTHLPGVSGPAAHLWSRTDLTVDDVDVAEVYDGFTFNCLSWLEALGVCGWGEAAGYLEGGKRIALDGELPLNTHGGQLSAGRLHGYGFVQEAMLQLRGQAEGRQVPDAEVALVAVGGGVPAGCFLLTR